MSRKLVLVRSMSWKKGAVLAWYSWAGRGREKIICLRIDSLPFPSLATVCLIFFSGMLQDHTSREFVCPLPSPCPPCRTCLLMSRLLSTSPELATDENRAFLPSLSSPGFLKEGVSDPCQEHGAGEPRTNSPGAPRTRQSANIAPSSTVRTLLLASFVKSSVYNG